MPLILPRQDWDASLPGAPPGNSGTIAWAVCVALVVVITGPALLIWHRRRKAVKLQMAKTAEGAAAWRAHRAQERADGAAAAQRSGWRRADWDAEILAGIEESQRETVPAYSGRDEGEGRPPGYQEAEEGTELRRLEPSHTREGGERREGA